MIESPKSASSKSRLCSESYTHQVGNEARRFSRDTVGCDEGRCDTHWVDFIRYGHQFLFHLNPNLGGGGKIDSRYNPVDEGVVTVPFRGQPGKEATKALKFRSIRDIGPQLFAT
jgi:hypothetical protein